MTLDPIRLFVVDDHPLVIEGIRLFVKDHLDIELIGSAQHAFAAKQQLPNLSVDVMLLDIQLPAEDGIEFTDYLVKAYPHIKIIGLTTHTEVSFISEMLRRGARGYLFKDTSEDELISAIRSVYAGNQFLSTKVNQKILEKVIHHRRQSSSFIPKLTRREKEVLQLIVDEHTSQEIADRLFLSVSTVEKHRMNLFIKLDVKNAVGLCKKAIKYGLLK